MNQSWVHGKWPSPVPIVRFDWVTMSNRRERLENVLHGDWNAVHRSRLFCSTFSKSYLLRVKSLKCKTAHFTVQLDSSPGNRSTNSLHLPEACCNHPGFITHQFSSRLQIANCSLKSLAIQSVWTDSNPEALHLLNNFVPMQLFKPISHSVMIQINVSVSAGALRSTINNIQTLELSSDVPRWTRQCFANTSSEDNETVLIKIDWKQSSSPSYSSRSGSHRTILCFEKGDNNSSWE